MLVQAVLIVSLLLISPLEARGESPVAPQAMESSSEQATDSGPAWVPIGPQGGDVRSLAVDPGHPGRVYLGGAGGELYRSDTGGTRWQRLSPGFPRREQNLDEMLVSPLGDLLIGFWDVHGRGGGVAVSTDEGATFLISLDGESVRALTLSASDPRQAFAGTLNGVFRSSDGGRHWERISPVGHPELHSIESLAVDPRDPRIIYAGTWHLPWKTIDGGATWKPINAGMISDSDVFTMTIDRQNPERVHATACSGIYGSRDGAASWSKVRGIPFSSRRSRAFAQDLVGPTTFYAGTTEGVWVSEDDTLTWRLSGAASVVVNAIATLPDGSVLVGADGAGVLRSADRGSSWMPSNEGFSERFVSSLAFDVPGRRVLAALWGDRSHGGVFSAPTPTGEWARLGEGLKGREVLSLALAGPRVLAGTDQGVFSLDALDGSWRRAALTGEVRGPDPRVNGLSAVEGAVVVAATSAGLFRSQNGGSIWRPAQTGDFGGVALSPEGGLSLAASGARLYRSRDAGLTWTPLTRNPNGFRVNAVIVAPVSDLALAATSRGLYRSVDGGETWLAPSAGLPESDFTGLTVSADGASIYVSDFTWGGVFRSIDGGVSWDRLPATGLVTDRVWALALSPGAGEELLAAPSVGGLHLMNRIPPYR